MEKGDEKEYEEMHTGLQNLTNVPFLNLDT